MKPSQPKLLKEECVLLHQYKSLENTENNQQAGDHHRINLQMKSIKPIYIRVLYAMQSGVEISEITVGVFIHTPIVLQHSRYHHPLYNRRNNSIYHLSLYR